MSFYKIFFFILFPIVVISAEWSKKEALEKLVKNVEYEFLKLPQEGESANHVWHSTDWPLKYGGTAGNTKRGQKSPLEKLEEVSPLSLGAVSWELAHADYNKYYDWAGHCNGLSVAGILYPEPKRGVVYKGVFFTPRDIKALLIELHQGPAKNLIGNLCANTFSSIPEDYELQQTGKCTDLNPAIFHLALTNIIGLKRKPFIIDQTLGIPVNNLPVISFRSRIKENEIQVWLSEETKSQFTVKTNVTFASKKSKIYHYILGLDKEDKIVSGKWIGKSEFDHPEFIWLPELEGSLLENPFIDFLTVEEIIFNSYL